MRIKRYGNKKEKEEEIKKEKQPVIVIESNETTLNKVEVKKPIKKKAYKSLTK